MTTKTFELKSGAQVPSVTVNQMREVDRLMIMDFHIDLVQMMENAGRNLADLACTEFKPQTVTVLAGPGGNGGGGLVAARHLHNRGIQVGVVLTNQKLDTVSAHQLDISSRMGIPVLERPLPTDLVIDAMIGYGLKGEPLKRTADLIQWANDRDSPILALDTPSGLDLTTGQVALSCIRATATMTLALPKVGLADADVAGNIYLADISVPHLLYERMKISVPNIFETAHVVELYLSQNQG